MLYLYQMRRILVLIVRLLVDPNDPAGLRGSIAVMPDGQPRPFSDGHDLLQVLAQAAQPFPEERSAEENQEGEERV